MRGYCEVRYHCTDGFQQCAAAFRRTLRYYAQSVGCPHCESGGNDRFQRLRLVDRQYLCQYCVAGGIDEVQSHFVLVRLRTVGNLKVALHYSS